MPKKSFFRKAADAIKAAPRKVANAVKAPFQRKKAPSAPAPTSAPTPVIPPKPEIPPHPRRVPPSTLSVDERVAQYKAMSPQQRRQMRPQDEDRLFWQAYDRGDK